MNHKLLTVLVVLSIILSAPATAVTLVPTTEPTINPAASDSFLCDIPVLGGFVNSCEDAAAGTGQGPAGPPGPAGSGNGSTYNYFNLSTGGGNFSSISNVTTFTYFTISQMNQTANQTPGSQGEQGIQGEIGPIGPMNQTANQTPGPKGDTGDIPDSSQFLFVNGSRSMTGNLNLGSNQIASLITGSTGDTAVNKTYVDNIGQAWATWTPTETWTGGPPGGSISRYARWTRIGRVVFFTYFYIATDSNGVTGLTISVPVTPSSSQIVTLFTGWEGYGPAGVTYSSLMTSMYHPNPYIVFWDFHPATDGQYLQVGVSGFYPVD